MAALAGDGKKADGKSLFVDNRCGSCHYVSSLVIGKKPGDGATSKAPDLSNVGNKYTADFMAKYLKKTEAINGRKHLASFKGTDGDLSTLTKWLATLKTGK